jgi:hypothetical protein
MTDHEAELEKLCRKLEASTRYEHQDGPTLTSHRNPDGPEAARLLREMAAENASLKRAHEAAKMRAVHMSNTFAEQAAENKRLRAGLGEVVCWFGEAPHTFPDWKTCAEALADMAQNVLDGHPALSTPETRQALTKGKPHD